MMKRILMTMTTGVLLSGVAFGQQKLDVQAHRGGMALMPENTIPAMLNAVKLGAKTLELDVVISGDGKVVVSHDAYMSSDFMRKPDGSDITKEEEKSMFLYKMTYDSISRFDAGTKPHPRFPEQLKMKVHRPLLSDLIDSVEAYVKANKLKPVYYNIETKISPMGDGVYNPVPDVFVETIMAVINKKNIKKRFVIQSFDIRTLQILHKTSPDIKLALLVSKGDVTADLEKLGFVPAIYSPYYASVNTEMIKMAHEKKMLVLPWTVDQEEEMIALGKLGVDGIITNKPDLLIKLFGSYQKK